MDRWQNSMTNTLTFAFIWVTMSHSLIRAGFVDSTNVDGIVWTMDQSINYVILRVYSSFISDQERHLRCGVWGLGCFQSWLYWNWGRCVLPVIMMIDKEDCGLRILQMGVNFACYYRMPKDWNREACAWQQACVYRGPQSKWCRVPCNEKSKRLGAN